MHLSADDGCMTFERADQPLGFASNIDLTIDATAKRSQTQYFRIRPASFPPESCAVNIATFDDERQRPTPPPPHLSFKTDKWTSIEMSLAGSAVAFAIMLIVRAKRGSKPLLKWFEPFEFVAKGFLAVLTGLVLTKTDFIGVTIDKTSANGFFTAGFFLGFVPLDSIFDRILKASGIMLPAPQATPSVEPSQDQPSILH